MATCFAIFSSREYTNMTLTFAYIDQAWENNAPKRKEKQKNECISVKQRKSYNKVYNDVLDTYLDEQQDTSGIIHPGSDGRNAETTDIDYYSSLPKRKSAPTPQPSYNQVAPLAPHAFEDSLEYTRYYKPDNMFPEVAPEETVILQEEPEYIPKMNEPVTELVTKTDTGSYIEFILFIVSGMFLIFILEQFVQIGMYLH
jgi:hypothetical protein